MSNYQDMKTDSVAEKQVLLKTVNYTESRRHEFLTAKSTEFILHDVHRDC
jgi:hypothetical protein